MNYRKEVINGIMKTDTKDVAIANVLDVFDKYEKDLNNNILIGISVGFVILSANHCIKNGLELVKAKLELRKTYKEELE